MRRLTLILSDLYLPEEAARGGDLSAALELPNLDWLLRFAQRVEHIRDWRSSLSADLGAVNISRMPVAQVCALGRLPDSASSKAWLATPVHLEVRLDHVRLADRGLLRLAVAERNAWSMEFARSFGPEYSLLDAGERSFLLSGASEARVASVDPARLLDADIGQALPSIPSGGELRRLGTEIEMWLHGAAANTAREKARQRRVSALWLWGGGASNVAPGAIDSAPSTSVEFFGGDPYLVALAGALSSPVSPPPSSFAALPSPSRSIVELTPLSGPPSESLGMIDAGWFAPVRSALSSGQLDSVDLIANDRWFRVAARPAWRVWRRRSTWLAQLGRHISEAKA